MRHETDGSRRQRADDLSPRIPDDGGIRGFHGGGHLPRHAVTFALSHSRPNGVFDRDNPMIEALPQFEDLVAVELGKQPLTDRSLEQAGAESGVASATTLNY